MEGKLPANDEEAERMLREGYDELVANCLVSIYQCWRAMMGATVLEAFEVALRTHLDAYRRAQQTRGESADGESAEPVWWAGYEYVDKSLLIQDPEAQ